jgi:hypothetical protein
MQVLTGDCLDILPTLDAESVDACVTDPPYGLSFMGKDWDHGVPGEAYWREVSRVLKPGGHLLAFGGTRTHHRLMVAIEDAGFEIRDCLMWLYGSGFPKGKSQLKPAYEPIILARKPLAGAVASNVLAHGTGALNIDATRIGTDDNTARHTFHTMRGGNYENHAPSERIESGGNTAGRWPANCVLDEEAARLLDEQSGERKTTGTYTRSVAVTNAIYGRGRSDAPAGGIQTGYGDIGGASRFYYCAKASRAERGAYNDHPTVKPLALMQWLVRLVTPPGGVVLDPFLGSGTTALACQREGFDCIGIELHPQYAEMARKRITNDCPMFAHVKVAG